MHGIIQNWICRTRNHGESMSENIVKKHDDEVYVFDFVKEKVELLESRVQSAAAVRFKLAEKSDVIISMVPKSEHSICLWRGFTGT